MHITTHQSLCTFGALLGKWKHSEGIGQLLPTRSKPLKHFAAKFKHSFANSYTLNCLALLLPWRINMLYGLFWLWLIWFYFLFRTKHCLAHSSPEILVNSGKWKTGCTVGPVDICCLLFDICKVHCKTICGVNFYPPRSHVSFCRVAEYLLCNNT